MTKLPPIRLSFGPLFWRAFVLIAVVKEWGLWRHLWPFLRNRTPGFRLRAMLYFTPRTMCRAMLIAAIATLVIDLYVRLVMRPIMARRLSPRRSEFDQEMARSFLLDSNETVLAESSGRRVDARLSQPGQFLLTENRILFVPHEWDQEALSYPLAEIEAVESVPAPSRAGHLLLGIPDQIEVTTTQGETLRFATSDPSEIFSWFHGHSVTEYQPSPMELL